MEIAGSSRPASGSEHLISHALDGLSVRPRLHGLQVGLATYWMALVQRQDTSLLERLFQQTGFWRYTEENPMCRKELKQALEAAPGIKKKFVTVLSDPEARERAAKLLDTDSRLSACLQR